MNDFTQILMELRGRLKRNPKDSDAGLKLARVMRQMGQLWEAEASLRTVLHWDPGYVPAVMELAGLYQSVGRPDAAEACLREAAERPEDQGELAYRLGFLLHTQRRTADARKAYEEALRRNPRMGAAHNNLAAVCLAQEDFAAARRHYELAVEIDPTVPEAWLNLAGLCRRTGDLARADQALRQVLARQPEHTEANRQLASLLVDVGGSPEEALACAEKALAAEPEDFQTNLVLGILHGRLHRPVQAAQFSTRAFLLSDRKSRAAADNLVNALHERDYTPGIIHVLADVAAAQPDNDVALQGLCFAKLSLGDWEGLSDLLERLAALPDSAITGANRPFQALYLPGLGAQRHKLLAQRRAELMLAQGGHDASHGPIVPGGPDTPLRIGYFSSDFHEHPTSQLVVGALEGHDHARFQIHAFSFDKDDGSAIRQRIRGAVDVFHDLHDLDAAARAAVFQSAGIHILVDLDALTHNNRYAIGPVRPAPVVVNWLACPGTLGHPQMADYLIGDPWVTPLAHAGDYSESLALMPHAYQPNDPRRPVGPARTRADEGLPETGFVFCCFNDTVKLNPGMFDLWCRLLGDVPDSCLWLLAPKHPAARENLVREMDRRGVSPDRLILAPRLPVAAHRGRLPLADLALDTLPYNSHTTASDALWAGVPLVTCTGDTFASRVGASLLAAVGLEECITADLEAYYRLALALATDPPRLAALREKLAAARATAPLFDNVRFARDLERLYTRMWQDHKAGRREAIVLGPDGD